LGYQRRSVRYSIALARDALGPLAADRTRGRGCAVSEGGLILPDVSAAPALSLADLHGWTRLVHAAGMEDHAGPLRRGAGRSASERASGTLLFANFRLDLANERLQTGSSTVKLKPKAYALLRYLVERPQRLVTKHELMNALWGEVHVGEAVLKTHLNQVRQALGDDVRAPSFIETVPRRGYRFVAEVHPAGLTGPALGRQARRAPQTRVVGREAQLEQLARAWDASLHGERRIVFISGEAGIGKSSLADAFVSRLDSDESVLVARGHCIEHHGAGEPYLPILEALERACDGPEGMRLINLLRDAAPNWLAQMPGHFEPASRAGVLDAKVTPERMLREMSRLVPLLTRTSPVVLVLEDLHWADLSTLALIDHLARIPDAARFLLIGTHRPQELILSGHRLRSLTQSLRTHRHCQEIELAFLGAKDIAEYLGARLEHHRLPDDLAHVIHRQTAGNPLFMVHVVDELLRQGVILERDGAWSYAGSLDPDRLSVPESLVGHIQRDLDRIDGTERAILEAASVAGSQFSSMTVAFALEREPAIVEDVCMRWSTQGRLIRLQRVEEREDGTLALECSFVHALYRQVVYESIPPTRQAGLHRRIGLHESKQRGQAGVSAANLALHFEKGRDYPRALEYRRLAGEDALKRNAYPEAIVHFRSALAMSERLPDTSERLALELDLLLATAEPLMMTVGFTAPETLAAYRRASELCKCLADSTRVPLALMGVASFHLASGAADAAERTGHELMEAANRQSNVTAEIDAWVVLGMSKFYQGELALAADFLKRCVSLYDAQSYGHRGGLYHVDPRVAALSFLAWTSWFMGHDDAAVAQAASAEAFARELEHPFTLSCALTFVLLLHRSRRDRAASTRIAAELMDLATEHGFVFSRSGAGMMKGALELEAGDVQDGLNRMRRAREMRLATGAKCNHGFWSTALAEACCAAGLWAEAHAALVDALSVVEEPGERFWAPEVYRLCGELSARVARSGEAIRSPLSLGVDGDAAFRRALDLAEEMGSVALRYRAALGIERFASSEGLRCIGRRVRSTLLERFPSLSRSA
jgi:DNA-binding winged helix-turn-helix (wHTH) protein